MPTPETCATCGTDLALGSCPGGLCAACLLSVALEDDPPPPALDRTFSSDFPPGSTLGPFHIVGLLGKGGMAAVYEAYDSSLERAVALKVLPPEFLHDESFARRFRQEGRLVARLEHPNIVPIYTSGIDEGIAWMSMRLLSGGSLGALLQRERPSPQRTVQILRPVADALDYAHARGVIHRDIKPTNILLDQAEHVCVADFGLAYMIHFDPRHSSIRTIVGTPQYMAPEAGLGQELDHRCDIYSLGVVAYEMLSGEPPFTAESPMAILLKHVNDDPPSPPAVAAPLLRAVHKALAKDPAERWSSAGAFVSALEGGLSGASSQQVPVVRPWVVIAAGGLTVAAAIFLMMRVQPPSESARPVDASPSPGVVSTPAAIALPPEPAAPIVLEPHDAPKQSAAKSVLSLPGIVSPATTEASAARGADPAPPVAAPGEVSAPVTITPTAPPEANSPLPIAESGIPTVQRAALPDVLVQPVRVRTVTAEYPLVARAAQIEGNVLLRATVGLDGAVTDVAVVRSVHPLLDEAARRAVLAYRYRPGLRNGVPEVATVAITVSFRLE